MLPELVAEKLTANSVKTGEDGWLVCKTDPAVNSGTATGGPSAGRVINMWSFYKKLTAPVLIVRGAESTALTRETVSKMLSVRPGTRAGSSGGLIYVKHQPLVLPIVIGQVLVAVGAASSLKPADRRRSRPPVDWQLPG